MLDRSFEIMRNQESIYGGAFIQKAIRKLSEIPDQELLNHKVHIGIYGGCDLVITLKEALARLGLTLEEYRNGARLPTDILGYQKAKTSMDPVFVAKALSFLKEDSNLLLLIVGTGIIAFGLYDYHHKNHIGQVAGAIKNGLLTFCLPEKTENDLEQDKTDRILNRVSL